ncbi:MAG TPA: VOC family protein [Pilimelia sp.]|nr:VOC family protein [Pilimelia sp.]
MSEVRFEGVTPYLYYEDANAALDWLATVLGFREIVRYVDDAGAVQEASMAVGDHEIHLTGLGTGHWERLGTTGPVGQLNIVYVDDVDAHYKRASAAGAVADPPVDKPYGARAYLVTDPGGNSWCLWQHIPRRGDMPGLREIRA